MKNLFIAILLLALGAIGLGIYFYGLPNDTIGSEPVAAIPSDAAIIIAYPSVSETMETLEQMDYYLNLTGIESLRPFFTHFALIDSLLVNDVDAKALFENATIWSSYHPTGGDTLEVLAVVKPTPFNENKVEKTFDRLMQHIGFSTEEIVGKNGLFKATSSNSNATIYYAHANGLVLISSTGSLIKRSMVQLQQPSSLVNNPTFKKALSAAGKNVDADIFINYQHLPQYLNPHLKKGVNTWSDYLGSVATWTELDLNLKEDGLAFNGFSYTNDSAAQYLNIFLNQKPQPIVFPDVLPANTSSFVFFGISDVMSISGDYRQFMEKSGRLKASESKLDSLNNLHKVDLENSILSWMGNEFGVCLAEPKSASFSKKSYGLMKARSPKLAEKMLSELAIAIDKKKGLKPVQIELDGTVIRKLNFANILSDILGPCFQEFYDPYYMIINDYVIFGKDPEALINYLRFIKAGKTLGKDIAFSEFANNLSSTYNVFAYHNLVKSKHVLESYLTPQAAKHFSENEANLSKFEILGFQFSSTGESFYSNAFVKYSPKKKVEKQHIWQAQMERPAQTIPVFVKNHITYETEILVQDEDNTLYLFNQVGEELFKVTLSEPILSKPVQIDAFKNGALQFIFNTKNFIHLIDRNGKYVSNYPVKLESPAQTDLTVVEYDGKKNYRLLITCENKHIYNYAVTGKKVSGWNHNKAPVLTTHTFKHLFVDGKDYLITGEAEGKIHLLDRRGKNRTKVESKIISSKNNSLQTFTSTKRNYTGVYLTTPNGLIHHVALDGKVAELNVGKFSEAHQFLVADLNNDGAPAFIFSDLNMLKVFNAKGELLFEQRLDPTATKLFLVSLVDGQQQIGVCYKNLEQLMLYNYKGELHPGFPLSGSSAFDVLSKKSEMLIVSAGFGSELTIQTLP
ncbi:DUF3352 domain-containing protein [Bacteroidota bacterium]